MKINLGSQSPHKSTVQIYRQHYGINIDNINIGSQGRIQSKISEGVQNFQGWGALFQLIK